MGVCTESIEEIDNEICTYSYQKKEEVTTAKTVEVSFEKQCDVQMVTVCQPAQYGYGHHHGKRSADTGYGASHNYCKEVAQETCYNVPIVTVVETCWDTCVGSVSSSLSSREENCLKNCAGRFV